MVFYLSQATDQGYISLASTSFSRNSILQFEWLDGVARDKKEG
jgi:hypothetical protein